MGISYIDGSRAERARLRLLHLVRTLSLKRGQFILASGALSDFYLDLRLTTTDAEGAALAARLVLAEARRLGANRVGGPTIGADPIVGASMALASIEGLPLRGFLVRGEAKKHGTARLIEGHVGPEDRVLVLDDVVTSAGSLLQAVDAVRATGAFVLGSFCLVDREAGGRERLLAAGAPLHAAFQVGEVLASLPLPDEASCALFTPHTPPITVDAIVELEPGHVLLIRRGHPPFGWALPGGFVEVGESLETAVRRELLEETGLRLEDVEQLHTYSEPGRDPRFHTVTTVFIANATGSAVAGDDAREARLFPIDQLPEDLCFDHPRVLDDWRSGRFGRKPGDR